MFAIIGIVVVFGAIVAGYLMEHGKLLVLMQPAELVIIFGAAVGTVLIGNTLRMSISGGVGHFDLDPMMEQDMEVHHREVSTPVTALNTMADSLPGLGIVAAVL